MWNFDIICEAMYEMHCTVQLLPYINHALLWISMDEVLHIEFPQYLLERLWDKVNL
jgi:hypothetical protein